MLLSHKFIPFGVKYFFLILIILPLSVSGQLKYKYKYKSKFVNGIYAESVIGKNYSINYNRNFYIGNYSFFSSSIGFAYNIGNTLGNDPLGNEIPNPFLYINSGLGIPVNVTYNHSIGSIDRALINMMSDRCSQPKYSLDWFLEAGLGATPSYLSKLSNNNGIFPSAYGGIRIHALIKRPSKDKDTIVYFRGGIKPFLEEKVNTFRYNFLGSIGISI